jgi:hypothetical protein
VQAARTPKQEAHRLARVACAEVVQLAVAPRVLALPLVVAAREARIRLAEVLQLALHVSFWVLVARCVGGARVGTVCVRVARREVDFAVVHSVRPAAQRNVQPLAVSARAMRLVPQRITMWAPDAFTSASAARRLMRRHQQTGTCGIAHTNIQPPSKRLKERRASRECTARRRTSTSCPCRNERRRTACRPRCLCTSGRGSRSTGSASLGPASSPRTCTVAFALSMLTQGPDSNAA